MDPIFNPREQAFSIISIDGPINITFSDIEYIYRVQQRNSIIFGSSIGAAGLALLALFIISNNRKTPVFIMNQISLLLVIIHSALYLGYLFGDYASMTFTFTGFPQLITSLDQNVSVATNFFHLALVAVIQVSLVFQVKTMFQGPNSHRLGYAVTALSFITGLATFTLYLYNFIKTTIVILGDKIAFYNSRSLNAQPILFASSINMMSVLLIAKLIFAIRSRRYLGLKQFDGFHILLIMTTQSLVVPSIVMILSYAVDTWTSVSIISISDLLVALSLPLSSMWAASANNATTPTSSGSQIYTPSSHKGTSFYSGNGTTFKGDQSSIGYDLEKKVQSSPTETNLFTPSTAAEEEAKRYWYGHEVDDDDNEDDSRFVRKTTHQIRSGNTSRDSQLLHE